MKISTLGVSHIGLGVKNLDRSAHFYGEVLGLPIVHEMFYDETPGILRFPQRPARRALYFRAGQGESAVVLVIGTIDGENEAGPILLDEFGIHHFSFWVDDIHALHKRLLEAGVEVILDPQDVEFYNVDQADRGRNAGPCATMFFRDPDGILLQADQRIERNGQ